MLQCIQINAFNLLQLIAKLSCRLNATSFLPYSAAVLPTRSVLKAFCQIPTLPRNESLMPICLIARKIGTPYCSKSIGTCNATD